MTPCDMPGGRARGGQQRQGWGLHSDSCGPRLTFRQATAGLRACTSKFPGQFRSDMWGGKLNRECMVHHGAIMHCADVR